MSDVQTVWPIVGKPGRWAPQRLPNPDWAALDAIIDEVAASHGLRLDQIYQRSRRFVFARHEIYAKAIRAGYSQNAVAAMFDVNRGTVLHGARRHARRVLA